MKTATATHFPLFRVLSPDGLDTSPNATYTTREAAKHAAHVFAAAYARQGHYLTGSGLRIAVEDLAELCDIVREPYRLPAHLWTFEGDLHSKRIADCFAVPLRRNYAHHHREITSVADLKATLRAGPVTWPGCYPLYFVTDDGAAISFATVREEFARIVGAMRDPHDRSGWRVVGCDVNYEDGELLDAHTGERIPSAYAEKEGQK